MEVPGAALVALDQGVDAGRGGVRVKGLAGVVEVAEDVAGRFGAVHGDAAQHVAQGAHGDGGLEVVARHVADDEHGVARGQHERVVPVAADLGGGAGGDVAGGHPQVVGLGQFGQQGALEALGGVPGLLEHPGVVHAEGDVAGQFGDQQDVVLGERMLLPGAHQGERAEHLPAGPQRGDDRRVRVQLLEQLQLLGVERALGPAGLRDVGDQ